MFKLINYFKQRFIAPRKEIGLSEEETSPPKLKVRLLTTTRDDLFDISEVLGFAIEPALFQDPKNPFIVAIRGSLGCGKKIITDGIRTLLLGETALSFNLERADQFHEYWKGQVDSREVEFHYHDFGHSSPLNGEIEVELSKLRKKGGITFWQNKSRRGKKSGIDLWLEKDGGEHWDMPFPPEDTVRAWKSELAPAFKEANRRFSNSWVRYLEVTVTDKILCNSPRFLEALRCLTAGCEEVQRALLRQEETVPLPRFYRSSPKF